MNTIPASEFRTGILMKCGCTAQGTLQMRGKSNLVGCDTHNCVEVIESKPSLAGRTARCMYGDKEVASSHNLVFFQHAPDKTHDEYYCGCFGWD